MPILSALMATACGAGCSTCGPIVNRPSAGTPAKCADKPGYRPGRAIGVKISVAAPLGRILGSVTGTSTRRRLDAQVEGGSRALVVPDLNRATQRVNLEPFRG